MLEERVATEAPVETTDPVCGMKVVRAKAVRAHGEYFCSEHCRDRFLASPGAFAR